MRRFIGTAATSGILITLFTKLLLCNAIDGTIYLGLISLALFAGLAIFFHETITEIDLKNFVIRLKEARKVRDQIKEIGLSVISLVADHSTYTSGTWKNRKNLNNQLEKAMETLNINEDRRTQIMYMPKLLERMMKEGREKLSAEEMERLDGFFATKR